MTKQEQIESNEVYKQILEDSTGGIMYDVDNEGKYDAKEILKLWVSMTPSERSSAGGIMKGAINFVTD